MKPPYFLKKLRIARLLFQPIFLISLALHGVVLMLPAPFDLDKPKPPKKEETVKITKLPATANSSSQVSPQSSPKPTPESFPQQNQSDFLQRAVARRVLQTNHSPDNEISEELVNPDTSQTKPQQNLKPKDNSEKLRDSQDNSGKSRDSQDNSGKSRDSQDNSEKLRDSQDNSEKSRDSQDNSGKSRDSQDNSGKSRDSGKGGETPPQTVNFFEQFPRYPGAEKGSGSVLRSQFDEAAYIFHTAHSLSDVALYFEKELHKNPNFKDAKPLTNESNFKLYEISNATGSETKYLHLIAKDGITAIYLESENYTMAQLIDAKTEDREYQTFLATLFGAIDLLKKQYKIQNFNPDKDLDTLAEKDKFKDNKFDLKNARKTTAESPVSPSELRTTLNQYLKLFQLDSLSDQGNYGGGTLYKLKSGKYESYLVFAPTKDNQTVIILSNDNPSQ